MFLATFPAATRTGDLLKHFSPFGKCRVKWIDDTSAYIMFEDSSVDGTKVLASGGPFTISTCDSQGHTNKGVFLKNPKLFPAVASNRRKRPREDDQLDENERKKQKHEFPENCSLM